MSEPAGVASQITPPRKPRGAMDSNICILSGQRGLPVVTASRDMHQARIPSPTRMTRIRPCDTAPAAVPRIMGGDDREACGTYRPEVTVPPLVPRSHTPTTALTGPTTLGNEACLLRYLK